MKTVYCSLISVLFLIAFSGCASTGGPKSSELSERVNNLETRMQKLEKGQMEIENVFSNQLATHSKKADSSSKAIADPSNKDIQAALKNAGFYVGEIDGKIGSKTRNAVMEFQKENDLKVDGIVGRNTWEILSQYNNAEEKD
jgi:murein L,D-transpeptidase YcbB/YkuD